MRLSALEQHLCHILRDFPKQYEYRYTKEASDHLLEILFRSLCHDSDTYFRLFFPQEISKNSTTWSLREAQGAVEGAEYTAGARGKPCGHIFKSGEATYRCKTCSVDDTCVLCSKCFDASDHTDHMVYVSISPGNSGCCDCGDAEAWRLPVNCAIHTAVPEEESAAAGKTVVDKKLPDDLIESIRATIARAMDYLCDVISCSPEQLRLPKTEDSIKYDEEMSRLTSKWYGGDIEPEEEPDFALILWNDEKHTVLEVENQVARACRETRRFGTRVANETNDMGRSVVRHSKDIKHLLQVAKIIEEIKVTVTIRSSRDTFREQMCGTIIEWLVDIAGCSVGEDHDILRQTICEEMLKGWRTGSEASNAEIGRSGIDDHEKDETTQLRGFAMAHALHNIIDIDEGDNDDDDDGEDDDGEDIDLEAEVVEEGDEMDLDELNADRDGDVDMDALSPEDETEVAEATYAGYPPPPPPPPPRRPSQQEQREHTSSDSEGGEAGSTASTLARATTKIPKTPTERPTVVRHPKPPKYWLEKPAAFSSKEPMPVYEDLRQRVRLDWLVLFDLRMWKKARIDLRDLYIGTVVTIPYFKRILGLRFAGLYTTLAQLYLIADREPDHSIINLSLQMLTTPSITDEVVERGNFLTNLIAILYTFLTTRQVGHPEDVDPTATLAFEAGSVTNRRMYHFFMDLKYLFGSEHVQEKLRNEERYIYQFLDLVKLHQGICPNVRAVGEHVEYETDAWISASLITREINRLCRQFAESFKWKRGEDDTSISKAIRIAAKAAILNSMGAERKRFDQAEIKEETRFKTIHALEAGPENWGDSDQQYEIVDFVIEKEPISFHHALHYTLSWLIDCGKSMSRDQLHGLLLFSLSELKEPPSTKQAVSEHEPESYLLALFDFPLRVCAWLAQMKAGMWVRNGLSLRHQMSTYRGVSQRDVAHHRDIFLMQTAMVICDSSKVLASMIDRFRMRDWMEGNYAVPTGYEDSQMVDVAEDFIHLMIIILSDRTSLLPIEDEPNPHLVAIRRDIVHTLCFKPLSFSELCSRLTEKFQDLEEFQDILDEMTNFRAPEGLSDTGTFELKEEYYEHIDPYVAHYNKNQRDEAENAYRTRLAKKSRKSPDDVVFEPKLRPITSGVFVTLGRFTATPLFAQVIYYSLLYSVMSKTFTPNIPVTRVETFIQVVLHLTLLAIIEDQTVENESEEHQNNSFCAFALTNNAKSNGQLSAPTIVSVLVKLLSNEDFKACAPRIRLILRKLHHKRPKLYSSTVSASEVSADRLGTESPANAGAEDVELKKKQALERQAKVMAQFQQQQKSFMDAHGALDWGDEDFSDEGEEMDTPPEEQKKVWKYPTGTCILCQEETNDSRLYGTFALLMDSNVLRQTDFSDPEFVAEAAYVPDNLDRSAEDIRPFGVAGKNRDTVRKFTADGSEIAVERQRLGRGFPPNHVRRGPVSTGCGHIMHFACFELYYGATTRRQAHQIARNHPERLTHKEFVCPLCKALGNAFLPIIWRGKEEVYPGILHTEASFDDWITSQIGPIVSRLEKGAEGDGQEKHRYQETFVQYGSEAVVPSLASRLDQLVRPGPTSAASLTQPTRPAMPGNFPLEDALTPLQSLGPLSQQIQTPSQAPGEQWAITELVGIYKRLRDTMKVNQLSTRYAYPPAAALSLEDLTHTDTLARSLGFSISSVEISRRGMEAQPGTTLIPGIPESALTHLRILSETVSSYMAVGGLRNSGANRTVTEFRELHGRQLHQLFIGHPQIFGIEAFTLELKQLEPLFCQDIFVFLAECSVCIGPSLKLDIHHLLRLCYICELVKVTFTYLCDTNVLWHQSLYEKIPDDSLKTYSLEQLQSFGSFIDGIGAISDEALTTLRSENTEPKPAPKAEDFSKEHLEIFRTLVANYALPFLRKAAILLYVRYGVDFHNNGYDDFDVPELDRLTKALNVPTLEEIFSFFSKNDPANVTIRAIVTGWIRHWAWAREGRRPIHHARTAITLSHPGILELVGLPKHFDTLTDEAMKRRCPTTGKEIVDPSICLFCGDIFCSQALCCLRDGRYGGCNTHLEKCGKDVGIFINIRKCTVLYLHGHNGSWGMAPYLDKHGEVDPGLRRNRQLFLNQRRYDALMRNVWLLHQIPTTISRKLEADTNNGGWETI
ncbi:hypothetical protein L228DRAFT_283538 [Xylona heveae TC161]|uniref:E3 ubiquitin-protein ligase n=1 Tax=Xylona heveae (strain CBS 132557 / TC161) TaxID=1328760 RepID=A0A165GMZ6_XYLHT|nr:hypothetical protein L228DRAFT_283538 [Xylona heveae TC161]KZF22387.1 hypothetical protein L228DRAFT_283538 [Xylona heveae TC161]